MKIHPSQMLPHAHEQEYNFKVRINHQNGAVTVHGPNSSIQTNNMMIKTIRPNLLLSP